MSRYNTSFLGSTVADYITSRGFVPTGVPRLQLWNGSVIAGYNRVNFSTPIFVTEGYVLGIHLPGSETIGLNNQSAGFYTDFALTRNESLPSGQNAYINLITNSTELTKATGITTRANKIKHTYSTLGTYALTTSFTCGAVTYSDVKYINGIFIVFNFTLSLS